MPSYRLQEWFRRLLVLRKSVLHGLAGTQHKAHQHVVFVAGVQRSGTNMMMDVLERSYETDVYHERDSRAFDNYQMRDLAVIRGLLSRSRAPCFVIKSLCELQDLPDLMDAFTLDKARPAKTIWINRHYSDVINSMLVSFRNQAAQVQRIAKYRDSDGWLSAGLSDWSYALIKELVHPDISDASAAALIWYFRSVLFFERNLDSDPRVQLVQYEDLVTQPQTEFPRIFEFAGLDYSERLSKQVSGSSVRRRSPPEIDAPIRDLCDSLLKRFIAVADRQRAPYARKPQ